MWRRSIQTFMHIVWPKSLVELFIPVYVHFICAYGMELLKTAASLAVCVYILVRKDIDLHDTELQ